MWNDEAVRLIGVRLDKLTDNINYQGSLFDDDNLIEESKVDSVVDDLKKKFGNKIINKASLSNNKVKEKLDFKNELRK